MQIYLLRLKMNGIKNISNEIQLDFYNKVLTDFNPEKHRVKAVYGENGSGKTAIITGINIVKKIVLSPDYLRQISTQEFLRAIINKKRKEFYAELEFLIQSEQQINVYRYAITLSTNKNGDYVISNEHYDVIKDYTKNKKFNNSFEVDKGVLKNIETDSETKVLLEKETRNLLEERSLAWVLLDYCLNGKIVYIEVFALLNLLINVKVYIETEDMHEMYLINAMLMRLRNEGSKGKAKELASILDKQLSYLDVKGHDIVAKKDYRAYKQKIDRLEKFIRLFKSNLKHIKIDRRDNGDTYVCEIILEYSDFEVSREFESTGIKKLIRLYDVLSCVDSGGIAFIDEMDSNLNDVYLCRLIEYFMYYGKGQLCFTTHNLDPMISLKENKNSIDFLTDNKVISWTSRGNAAPERCYRNGMIEDIPFNIDSTDFIGVFGEA